MQAEYCASESQRFRELTTIHSCDWLSLRILTEYQHKRFDIPHSSKSRVLLIQRVSSSAGMGCQIRSGWAGGLESSEFCLSQPATPSLSVGIGSGYFAFPESGIVRRPRRPVEWTTLLFTRRPGGPLGGSPQLSQNGAGTACKGLPRFGPPVCAPSRPRGGAG